MLENVKLAIENIRDIPFEQFYLEYMMEVQDSNIECEVVSTFRKVSSDVSSLTQTDHLIHTTFEGLVRK